MIVVAIFSVSVWAVDQRPVIHAVFLTFKPDTSQAKIDEIFKAVEDMKGKIPGIIDISWGPYSSNEGMNRGYTHGCLITFVNEAARDAYLPHPEHKKVADLLIPHLAPMPGKPDDIMALAFDWKMDVKPVKHVVLLTFKPSTPKDKLDEILAATKALKDKIPGMIDLSMGPYSSSEGMNRGYEYGLVMTFASAAYRDAYLPHPEHKKVADLLIPHLAPMPDNPDDVMAMAFDWIEK
jgi:hypothetical protein